MEAKSLLWILRVASVVAVLGLAGFLSTPEGRTPLALRGIYRMMRRDRGDTGDLRDAEVSGRRRFIAFLLVILAVVLAVI